MVLLIQVPLKQKRPMTAEFDTPDIMCMEAAPAALAPTWKPR